MKQQINCIAKAFGQRNKMNFTALLQRGIKLNMKVDGQNDERYHKRQNK